VYSFESLDYIYRFGELKECSLESLDGLHI